MQTSCACAKRVCTTHAATSNSLQQQQEQKAIVQFGNNAFEGLLTAAAPIYATVLVLNTLTLILDTTKDGYATVWLLKSTIKEEEEEEEEEEAFYKLLPANKAEHLCQSWQSCSNLHEI